MRTPSILGPLALGAVGAASTVLFGAAYFARRVVIPTTTRREDLAIRNVLEGDDGALSVALPRTPLTTAPGRYSLWFDGGASPSLRYDTTSDVRPSLLATGTPRRAPARFPPMPCACMAHVLLAEAPGMGWNFQAGASPPGTCIFTSSKGRPSCSGREYA